MSNCKNYIISRVKNWLIMYHIAINREMLATKSTHFFPSFNFFMLRYWLINALLSDLILNNDIAISYEVVWLEVERQYQGQKLSCFALLRYWPYRGPKINWILDDILLHIKRHDIYIYICYQFTDTTTPTLGRYCKKTKRDRLMQLFELVWN